MRHLFARAIVAVALLFSVSLVPRPAQAAANWVKVGVDFTQVQTASTSKTLTLYTTKATESIERVVMRRDVDFAGGSISAETVSVGRSGATTRYQAATDIFTGVSNGDTNSIVTTAPGIEVGGTAIIATFTSTSANHSALTAGHLTFFILVSSLPPGN